MATAWVDASLSSSASVASRVVNAMTASGLEVVSGPRAADPGVVLFDAASATVETVVRAASDGGRRRVLALAVSPAGLGRTDPWRLLRLGASDVVAWDGGRSVDNVAARLSRWAQVEQLFDSPAVQRSLVGRSPQWLAALRQILELARFTTASLLITGESGTGKELVARLVHELDVRPDKGDLVVVDCTTVVPTLSGSEFFGHERGAFTGAVSTRDGAFALASGGTLFLDEVGELPLPLQAELLRVVQEGMYKRVGSNVWQRTAFRLVCATNRELLSEEAAGRFRRDFYYRIASSMVRLPPLRDRAGDVIPLFRHFLGSCAPSGEAPELDPVVAELLVSRAYPGNVRDLRQLAIWVAARHLGSGPITPGDIPDGERPQGNETEAEPTGADFEDLARWALGRGMQLKELREAVAEAAVRVAVADARGNLQAAARRLGVTDRALQLRRAGGRQLPGPATHGSGEDGPTPGGPS